MHTATAIPALPQGRPTRTAGRERLWTSVGSALDSAMMRGVQVVVERALIPDHSDLEALRDSADAMRHPTLVSSPRSFFDFADERALPHDEWVYSRRKVSGGSIARRHLVARYRPYTGPGARAVDAISNGGPMHVEYWQHDGGATRGTVLALHGFAMGRPAIDAPALFAQRWFDHGLDVALLTLPHHGARKPDEARFSGEHFAVPHVGRLAEAVREAIYEILVLRNWLREQNDAPVGLLGLSLGGYLTSLAIGLCDDFDFAVPIVPPACMGDLAWRVFRGTRHGASAGGGPIDEAELRAAFRVHSPLAHARRVPRERILIVAGRGDRVVPPEHPTALWEHWDEPAIHWFSGSHLAPFGRAQVVASITRHFDSLGIR